MGVPFLRTKLPGEDRGLGFRVLANVGPEDSRNYLGCFAGKWTMVTWGYIGIKARGRLWSQA